MAGPMPEAVRTVVVGAGTMGVRVALRCARSGIETSLVARDLDRARNALREAAAEVEDAPAAEAVRVTTALDAVAHASVIYEAIPEALGRKQTLLAEIEAFVGDEVPLVSGTSSFFPDALGFDLEFPQRVFVAHFVHPVTLVALAEIVEPADPDPSARLQFALLREALHIVERGGATAAEVDAVMRFGLGPRWTATGPIESIALGGKGTFADVARAVVPSLDARPDVPLLGLDEGRPAEAGPDRAPALRARLRAYQAAAEIAASRER